MLAIRALHRYDRSRPFYPWLYRIVRNHCIDRIRRRREYATDPSTFVLPDLHSLGPEAGTAQRQTNAAVRRFTRSRRDYLRDRFSERTSADLVRQIVASPDRAGLEGAQSTEFFRETPHPVIGLITEWQDEAGNIERRDENSDLGGTMRLGGQSCKLKPGTLAHRVYGKSEIIERHRHRYEFNNTYRETLDKAGLTIAGTSADNGLVEVVEITDHPWFLACQFHPEFTSTPRDGHPLFTGFIEAANEHRRAAVQENTATAPSLVQADG